MDDLLTCIFFENDDKLFVREENDHHRVSSMSHNLMKIHTVAYFTISNCGQFSHDFLFSIFDGVYIFHLDW